MDMFIALFVLSSLPQLVTPVVTSLRAEIKAEPQALWLFTGDRSRLTCSIPDNRRSVWNYRWFKDSEELPQTGQNFSLWNVKLQQNGNFSCEGVRDMLLGKLYTVRSLPVEVRVDGGLAVVQVLHLPGLIGKNISMTCRVRRNPPIHEVILYKDSIEVRREFGPNAQFNFTNLRAEDAGTYSCRASWDVRSQTISVLSGGTYVQVAEILSQPVLEIDTNLSRSNEMRLTCHVHYNAHSIFHTPTISFSFYKDNVHVFTTAIKNYEVVKKTPGRYSCKVRVLQLDYTKWSEPKEFGRQKDPQTTALPSFSPTPVLKPSAAQPIATPLTTTAPSHLQYTQETGEGSGSFSEESGDDLEESGDDSEESGDYSGGSGW